MHLSLPLNVMYPRANFATDSGAANPASPQIAVLSRCNDQPVPQALQQSLPQQAKRALSSCFQGVGSKAECCLTTVMTMEGSSSCDAPDPALHMVHSE